MEIRKVQDTDIETKNPHMRTITGKASLAGSYGSSLLRGSVRGAQPAMRIGIQAAKNAFRPKDVRSLLKHLSPEQRRQWNSYSYKKQSEVLEKAGRMAEKAAGRDKGEWGAGNKGAGKNTRNVHLSRQKILRYELNSRAKGNAISNSRGTGERWDIRIPKGQTARQMQRSMKRGQYQTVTFYTGSISAGVKKARRLERTYQKTARREKWEGKALFLTAFGRVLNEEAQRDKQIEQMQKKGQISQMQAENAQVRQTLHYTSMPIRAKVASIGERILKRLFSYIGGLALKIFLLLLSLLLPVLLILGLIVACISALDLEGTGTYAGGDDIVQVALQEEKPENINGEKYWRHMGFSYRVAWCACFVSWCGSELDYQEQGIMPSSALCDDFRDYYRAKDRLQRGMSHGGTYLPKSGDLVLFQWDGIMSDSVPLDHIGIVVSCDGLTVNTVEGNTSNMVAQRSYAIGDPNIIWYCVPDYPVGGLGGTGEGGHATDGTTYTMEQLEVIWAIIAQEDNGSYDGALAVISCAMNRVESPRWQGAGSNALEQLQAPGQFCYSNDTYWHKWLGGNVPEYVKQAVSDCLENGIRNHDYTCFRSRKGSETGDDAVQIGGNWFFSPK